MEGLEIPSIHIDEKELSLYRERAEVVAAQATQIAKSIVDAPSCQAAVDWCGAQITFAETVEKGWLGRIKAMWHKQHSNVCTIINDLVDPHKAGVTLVKESIRQWRAEEERKLKIEQDRLNAEALKRDAEDRLNSATQLAAQDQHAMADAVLEGAGNFLPPVVVSEKVKGVGGRKRWKIRCLDKVAFIKAAAGGAVPHNAIVIDERWIEKQANLMDGNLSYPGIQCYEEEIISIRRSA